ncbi:MAG: hypothetical protein K9N51_10580 [Candidatus Pacebacteria bacterium]|nr:hypothetical protein [Candidatus Paceibacterota bacterium]
MNFTIWDILLLLVVSLQATLIAYVRQPRVKALIVTFPFPFSVAFLALGQPVNGTNMLGLILLLLFTHGVRWLHLHARHPIIPSIVGSALGYCLLGAAIARVLPREAWTFWAAAGLVFCVGAVLVRFQPHRAEPAHRSPLPLYVKLPLIMAIITGLIVAKHWLQGFMTVFPMVGVIAAYEARHSLWTMTRQIPVIMLALGAMMIAMFLTQSHIGAYGALGIGWLVFGATLLCVECYRSNVCPDQADRTDPGDPQSKRTFQISFFGVRRK